METIIIIQLVLLDQLLVNMVKRLVYLIYQLLPSLWCLYSHFIAIDSRSFSVLNKIDLSPNGYHLLIYISSQNNFEKHEKHTFSQRDWVTTETAHDCRLISYLILIAYLINSIQLCVIMISNFVPSGAAFRQMTFPFFN